jgi:hypothetical protein
VSAIAWLQSQLNLLRYYAKCLQDPFDVGMVLSGELWKVRFQRLNQGFIKKRQAWAFSAAQKQLAIGSCEGRSADTRRKRSLTIGITDVSATLKRTNSRPVASC